MPARGRALASAWWVCLLLLVLGPAPAFAQSGQDGDGPGPGSLGLDLTPIVDLVCDLLPLPLICPPEPSAQAPPSPAPETQAPLAVSPEPTDRIELPVQQGPEPTEKVSGSPGSASVDLPALEGPETPSRVPALSDSTQGTSAPRTPRQGNTAGLAAPLSLARPREVDFSGPTIVLAAGLSVFGLILIGFPAELFNKTVRENYGRLAKAFPWLRSGSSPRGVGWQLWALLISSALAGAIGSLQKVRVWNPPDILTVTIALGIGFLLTNAVYELASQVAANRLRMPPRSFRSYPGALPVVALFVGISTLAGLQPAYVYGHIAGSRIENRGEVELRSQALQTVSASAALLIVAIACWAMRAVVTESPSTDILAGITIVGLNRLVFALVPATFLDGLAPFKYSRLLWASIYVPTLVAFLLLVLLPAAQRAGAAPIGASAVLFALFAGMSVGLWGYFKRARQPAEATPS